MDIGVISVRYARALLKSATEQQLDDAVYQEMQLLAKSYIDVPQLRQTIDNPMLSKDKKEALLLTAVGGEPTVEVMQALNADQMTLLCWDTLHQEVMDGGFIQLIHNGYGPFIFKNPFAKALNKMWHMRDLSKMLYEVHTLWLENREVLEMECSDEEFMALFEKYPQFDDYDDMFVENEERWTEQVAHYVDENIEKFVVIENE